MPIGLGIRMGIGSQSEGGAAPTWSPSDLTPLVWFDASAGTSTTTNGAAVTTWTDQENGIVATSSGSPLYVSSWANGAPAISFNAINQWFANTATSLMSAGVAHTVLSVGDSAGGAGKAGLFTLRLAERYSSSGLYIVGGDTYIHGNGVDAGNNVTISSTGLAAIITNPFQVIHKYSGAGNAPVLYLNNTSKAITAGVQGTEDGTTGFQIGKNNSALQLWGGHIAEIVVVAGAISDVDRALWNTYCNEKYGTPTS